jgi:lipoprotein-anchoring transpeptidase ErfK/SrfK
MAATKITRRDFIKLSSAGLLGLALSELGLDPAAAADPHPGLGRVAYPSVDVFDRPTVKGQKATRYLRDTVLAITDQVTGEDETAYNPIWYRIGDEGFAYSGAIQPVRFDYNAPVTDLPEKGTLGEITVPFADATWGADYRSSPAYRLYYETTHWVKDVLIGKDDNIYYHLYDDRLQLYYYAPAWSIRILPAEELAPLSASVPNEAKFIDVSLDEQRLIAYEGDTPVFTTRVSSGRRASRTPRGHFLTFHKRATRHMIGGDLAAPVYDLPGVPWVIFITEGGVSFHGTYWHNDYGTPHSAGCINLSAQAAKWIFRWTMPSLPPERRWLYEPGEGTLVRVGGQFEPRRS